MWPRIPPHPTERFCAPVHAKIWLEVWNRCSTPFGCTPATQQADGAHPQRVHLGLQRQAGGEPGVRVKREETAGGGV